MQGPGRRRGLRHDGQARGRLRREPFADHLQGREAAEGLPGHGRAGREYQQGPEDGAAGAADEHVQRRGRRGLHPLRRPFGQGSLFGLISR